MGEPSPTPPKSRILHPHLFGVGAKFWAQSAQNCGAEGAFLEELEAFSLRKEFLSQFQHKSTTKSENIVVQEYFWPQRHHNFLAPKALGVLAFFGR